MSVAHRFNSEVPSVFPKTTAPETNSSGSGYRPRNPEAPDRGLSGEAPEARASEAPDAGEGRSHFMEQEYTHGRSQS